MPTQERVIFTWRCNICNAQFSAYTEREAYDRAFTCEKKGTSGYKILEINTPVLVLIPGKNGTTVTVEGCIESVIFESYTHTPWYCIRCKEERVHRWKWNISKIETPIFSQP